MHVCDESIVKYLEGQFNNNYILLVELQVILTFLVILFSIT